MYIIILIIEFETKIWDKKKSFGGKVSKTFKGIELDPIQDAHI